MSLGFLSLLRLFRILMVSDRLARANGNNYFIRNGAWLDHGGPPGRDRMRRNGGKPPFPRRIQRVNRVGRERRLSLYYVASPIRL